MSEPALYTVLTFHVPNLMSFFLSLGRLSKESVEVRGPLWHFVTSLFLWRGVVSPTPNLQAGGLPLVNCPWLFIQYICSYPPYLEAIPSIRNVRTRHAVVTKDPLNMDNIVIIMYRVSGRGQFQLHAARLSPCSWSDANNSINIVSSPCYSTLW
jgi:hypothetical protein